MVRVAPKLRTKGTRARPIAGGEVGLRSIPLIDIGKSGPAALLDADRTRADDILAIARRQYSRPILRIGDQLSRAWLERTGNPYLGELDAVAAHFEHPGVYILNLSHEWFCTSAVLPAAGGGMKLLRSLDWPIEGFGRNVVVAKHERPAGAFYNFTWPGFLGSANGIAPGRFAAAINQAPIRRRWTPVPISRMLHRREIWRRGGLPPPHLLRQVFETCETYDDAKRMLTETPVCAPVIYSLAGAGDDEGCVIQRLPDRAVVRDGQGCIANHWLSDGLTRHRGRPDSYTRYATMERVLREWPSGFDWLVPPVLSDWTRLAFVAEPRRGSLAIQGFEEDGPATEILRLDGLERRPPAPLAILAGDPKRRPLSTRMGVGQTAAKAKSLVASIVAALVSPTKGRRPADRRPAAPPPHPWERSYPAGIDWRGEIPVKPLFALLDDTVKAFPTARAMDFLGKRYTYREIDQLVNKVARGLQDLGVVKGTKIGLMLPNTPYYVAAYYGALKAGAVVVNYNPLYAERELVNQIENSGTEIMFTLDLAMLYGKVAVALPLTNLRKIVLCRMSEILPFPESPLYNIVKRKERAAPPNDRRHISFAKLVANDGRYQSVAVDPKTDVAVLQYTGGTTGVPKGAMLTHANLYGNAVQVSLWFPGIVRGGERLLGVLPFFHVFGMTAVMNTAIMTGAELIALPRFEIKSVLKAIDRKKPTLVAGVPTMFAAINNYAQLSKYDLNSIKFCISGGAPLPRPTQSAFEAKTGCRLVEGYGLTESSPVAACNPFVGQGKPGSVGLPLPGTIIEIVDRDDPSKLLPHGEKGEVCIRGPQVMNGYYNRPDDNKNVLSGGRLHTGDIGYMDADGYTFLVDRIKDLILVGGYNVYPRNVEEAIAQHPAVEEVCVIGVPDEYRGEAVKAFIKRRDGETLDNRDLLEFLKDKLSPFERPRLVEFRDALPKTLIGKPSREALVAEERARTKVAG